MPTPILPEPIAAYFAAEKKSPEVLARCFTPQASVKDEGHTHTGLAAIQAWQAAVSTRYTYTTQPLGLEREAHSQVVRARVSGNFPGSPVDLRYSFQLERGLIAALEITA
ncbi:MAG: nuclear transport factor 2 family protein [Comamonas sp.]